MLNTILINKVFLFTTEKGTDRINKRNKLHVNAVGIRVKPIVNL